MAQFFHPLVQQLEDRRLLTGTITGRLWYDGNYNGQQDVGEGDVNNVTVTLLQNGNVKTSDTSTNGLYTLNNITAGGGYYLRFTFPAGYTLGPTNVYSVGDTLDNDFDTDTFGGVTAHCPSGYITVNDGDSLDFDAGLVQGAHLTVFSWLDDDNPNGLQDATTAEQAGLGSVHINLKTQMYSYAFAYSGANGIADFTNVRPGTYHLTVDRFPYTYTIANAGNDMLDSDVLASGDTADFTLIPKQARTDIDLGWVTTPITTGSVTGTSWFDDSKDGIHQAGETSLADTMYYELYSSTDDIVGNADDQFYRSTYSSAPNNTYQFVDVDPGKYYVKALASSNLALTLANRGSDDTLDSDFSQATNCMAVFMVTAGNTVANVDAGYINGSASIGNLVWEDTNADGIKDANETGLANARVQLFSGDGGLIGSEITTDNTGGYDFTGLVPGAYFVRILPPLGYIASPKDQTIDTADSDIDYFSFKTATFTLAAGQTQNQWDAGFYQGATISDRVWVDKQPINGIQDAGEANLPNATINLYNALGQYVASALSDANGKYSIVGLPSGQYYLGVTPPSGYLVSLRDVNGDAQDTVDNDFDSSLKTTILFNVTRGVTYSNWDAGLYLGAKVGDKVWLDTDCDGRQDANEPGKQSVTVKLKTLGPDRIAGNADDAVVGTTTTNAAGSYQFTGVRDGTFYVEFVRPGGFVFTQRHIGDIWGDSDTGLNTGRTQIFTIANSVNNLTLDAGLVPGTTIDTHVGEDGDGDGVIDANSGIGSIKITIIDTGNGVVGDGDDIILGSGFTNSSGDLDLSNLRWGWIVIRVDLTEDWGFADSGRGGDGDLDSDIVHLCDGYGYTMVQFVDGGGTLSISVGLVPLAGAIEGTVWNDQNRNKVRDGGLIKGTNPDVILAIDVSGSTSESAAGYNVGDVNGDGFANTILDAEISAGIQLVQQLTSAGLGWKTHIGIVTFSGGTNKRDMNPITSGVQLTTAAAADANGNSTSDVIEVLKSIRAGGQTNYEAALQAVISEFQTLGTPPGSGNMIFLSDGVPTSGGSFIDEVTTLKNLGINLRAFGVGAASLEQLQKIDPQAKVYKSSADLLVALNLNNTSSGRAAEPGQANVRVYLDLNNDGIWQTSTEPSLLTATDDPDTPDVDETGTFRFSHLAPGQYIIREVVPAGGYVQTLPGYAAGNGYLCTITAAGETIAPADFGNAANPKIAGLPTSVSYTHGSGLKQLGVNAVITDSDTPILNGGKLTVRVKTNANANDVLAISPQGTGAGQINVSGTSIKYGSTVIGTFTGGTGSTALVITLNSSASLAAVQALARRIAFRNTLASPPTATRTIEWTLTDGTGGASAAATATVTIV